MQGKDRFLRKLPNTSIYFFFILILIFPKNIVGEEYITQINQYIRGLDNFASKFIQSNGNLLEEGSVYIKDDKIRLDYFYPERSLILSKKKGVYINHELQEEEFFSTEKNIVKIFYDIFLNKNFFSSLSFEKKNGEIIFKKEIIIDSDKTKLKIFFENRPILLRKIVVESKNSTISFSLNDHNYNADFDERFFSFVPKYPN